MNWEYDGYDMEYHDVNIGNTFACKFSKNRNNLHIMACVTEHGEVVVQNTKKHCDFPYEEYHISKCKINYLIVINILCAIFQLYFKQLNIISG